MKGASLPFLLGPRHLGHPGTFLVLWTSWVWRWSQTRHTQSAGSPGSPWSPPQSEIRNKRKHNLHYSPGLLLQVRDGWHGPKIIFQCIFAITMFFLLWQYIYFSIYLQLLNFWLSLTGCKSTHILNLNLPPLLEPGIQSTYNFLNH